MQPDRSSAPVRQRSIWPTLQVAIGLAALVLLVARWRPDWLNDVFAWIAAHPILGGLAVLYGAGGVFVALNQENADEISLGGYALIGVAGVIVIAVLQWAFGAVFT